MVRTVWYVLDSFSSSSVAEVIITLKEDRWLDAAFTKPNNISVLNDLKTVTESENEKVR